MPNETPTILVVDDDEMFVDSLVAAFKARGVEVEGCKKPSEVLRWSKREDFAFDLILLDMRLGISKRGEALNAAKVLPHLKTYSPSAKVVVFSQKEVNVEECVTCIRLGALGIIPKSVNPDDLVLIAQVYRQIGDKNESREELIRLLWQMVRESKDQVKGQYLEMLMINLFNSMPTFKVIGQNLRDNVNVGEIDILVENTNKHDFWHKLDSLQIVIECKNQKDAAQVKILTQLKELVLARGQLSKAGILVSMNSVTRGFKQRRNEIRQSDHINIFFLERSGLQRLVGLPYDKREEYLRDVFSKQ
jgi:ActR/RegA family two-component response regulator